MNLQGEEGDGPGPTGYIGPFILLWALAQLLFASIHHPEVFFGHQVDADGYMRLLRVRDLMQSGTWFDPVIERGNWPFGEIHHWTRPLDLIIGGLTLLVQAFAGPDRALEIAGMAVGPLLHLALCLVAVWAVGAFRPGWVQWLAMPAVLLQPGLLVYGTAGRADHHVLIFFLYMAAVGAWLRTLLRPERLIPPVATGVLAGLGIWVSPEFLLPLALVLMSGGVVWILDGGRPLPRAQVRLCAGLLGTLVLAIAAERPSSGWAQVDYDRISAAHVTVAILGMGFWWLMLRLEDRKGDMAGPGPDPVGVSNPAMSRRLVMGLGGGLVVALATAFLHPAFFRGPWVDVEPEVIEVWLHGVQELQPIFPRTRGDLGPFMQHLGPGWLALGALAAFIRLEAEGARRRAWVFLLLSLLVYLPLAAHQVRFSGYVGAVSALVLVELLRRVLVRLEAGHVDRRASLLRVGAMLAILGGPPSVGAVLSVAWEGDGGSGSGLHTDAATDRSQACRLTPMARVLADPSDLGEEPRTIAAFIDYGPELLYRTPHRVLAGPYHRNAQGILGAYRLLTATDDAEALALAREREVDWILLCPSVDQAYFGRGGEDGLYTRLLDGRGSDWIRPRELPPEAPEGFLLFEVNREPRGS